MPPVAETKIDRINIGFANGADDIAEFKELKILLVAQKADWEEKISALKRSKANRLELMQNRILEVNTDCFQSLTKLAGHDAISNKSWLEPLFTYSNLNSFIKLLPFDSLAEITLAMRSTLDVSTQSSIWWRIAVSNR